MQEGKKILSDDKNNPYSQKKIKLMETRLSTLKQKNDSVIIPYEGSCGNQTIARENKQRMQRKSNFRHSVQEP